MLNIIVYLLAKLQMSFSFLWDQSSDFTEVQIVIFNPINSDFIWFFSNIGAYVIWKLQWRCPLLHIYQYHTVVKEKRPIIFQ